MSGDFSKPYQGVAYFGVWTGETCGDYGTRDAVTVLIAAVKRCRDEDKQYSKPGFY